MAQQSSSTSSTLSPTHGNGSNTPDTNTKSSDNGLDADDMTDASNVYLTTAELEILQGMLQRVAAALPGASLHITRLSTSQEQTSNLAQSSPKDILTFPSSVGQLSDVSDKDSEPLQSHKTKTVSSDVSSSSTGPSSAFKNCSSFLPHGDATRNRIASLTLNFQTSLPNSIPVSQARHESIHLSNAEIQIPTPPPETVFPILHHNTTVLAENSLPSVHNQDASMEYADRSRMESSDLQSLLELDYLRSYGARWDITNISTDESTSDDDFMNIASNMNNTDDLINNEKRDTIQFTIMFPVAQNAGGISANINSNTNHLSDRVYSEEMMTRLISNLMLHLFTGGDGIHHPASQSSIHALQKLSREDIIALEVEHMQRSFVHGNNQHVECAICTENIAVVLNSKEDEAATQSNIGPTNDVLRMPCQHFFHAACITTWLNISNSCPTCRYELLTDDPEYNEDVVLRMAARSMRL